MTSVATRRQAHDSGDYSDASHPEIEQDISGNDGGQQESDYESQGSDSERSDQDPENQETERRVDDDEDRSNPQYIPKRGTFYEHDDRTAASGEESSNTTSETTSEKKEGTETPSERRRPPRKSETINKWSHDKFNENEQMPKSRDELVAIYGYDIRNEDAPPHARRNRRYGRGPNKYTRTWEDEEAYKRQAQAAPQPRKPPNPEDFPELDAANNKKRVVRPRSKSQPSSVESVESVRRPGQARARAPRTHQRAQRNKPPQRDDQLPSLDNLTITASVFNNSQGPVQRKVSAAPVAQQRPVPTEQAKKKPQPTTQQPNVSQNNGVPAPKPAPQPAPAHPAPQPQQQVSGAEPRGSKRYSSLRQRPLDTYAPQTQPAQPTQPAQQSQPTQQSQPPQQSQQTQAQQPPQHRYHAEYGSSGAPAPQHQGSPGPQLHPQQMMQQLHLGGAVSQPAHGPSPPHQLPPQTNMQHTQQQVRLGLLDQQQIVSHPHHAIHNMPQPHNIGPLQPAQGYAPPAMMPAQYMQQSGSGAVFGGAALYAQPPAPYTHQMQITNYPHHNYAVPVPQATQAGGVTYYRCAEQERGPPPPQPRRPTAAIPIVRPAREERQDRPANSSEKDNIDRIVENMFVRKPWPATHGADASKEKTETRNSQEPPSKESSQPNSLTSSSISTDSKPSEGKEPKEDPREAKEEPKEVVQTESGSQEVESKEIKVSTESENQESIQTDA